jgi:hypothetical protein
MPQTLGQVVAAEAAARAEANKRRGTLHKQGQKGDLFEGFDTTYSPFAEADDGSDQRSLQRPPEGKRVQLIAEDLLREFMNEMRSAIDLAAVKDEANCRAKADVITPGGSVLLRAVPATHLLHMEKVLEDFGAFIARLPVRDPAVDWTYNPDDRLAHSPETFTNSEEVRTRALVIVPPTQYQAGQGTAIQERVAIGRRTTVRHTGALSVQRKRDLERRVAELKVAFKQARETANRAEAADASEAEVLFGYILG